ncbi:Protein UBASH3A homolog [Strongyloides ratti]|uniref:Protein UBASH3A homolog n=1 Tax=Strongyloides ratti TaxID=34506 RepID=A0A090L9U2_STRRB|nr:Protein UBASH3A homolog [Strongyloides ratti]CEF66517.1 Protein UBASH3A homolog [Strongyloides ratti]
MMEINSRNGLRIIGMRHSERLDHVYPSWFKDLKNSSDYETFDANMPFEIPNRDNMCDFEEDTVLTLFGTFLAQLTGKGLGLCGSTPDYIYCSPALRSIQTAIGVLDGSGSGAKIKIEPGLFENCTLYQNKRIPTFMSLDELSNAGFTDVDYEYKHNWDLDDLFPIERKENDYIKRFNETVSFIQKEHSGEDAVILLVGHASTVDLLLNYYYEREKPYEEKYLLKIGEYIPYCSTIGFDQQKTNKKNFVINTNASMPYTKYNFTTQYDYSFVYRDIKELRHLIPSTKSKQYN